MTTVRAQFMELLVVGAKDGLRGRVEVVIKNHGATQIQSYPTKDFTAARALERTLRETIQKMGGPQFADARRFLKAIRATSRLVEGHSLK